MALRLSSIIRHTRACATAETMRGMVLREPGPIGNMTLERVPLPNPGPGQVRVAVSACGVCHRDLLDRRGAFPFIQRPTILGHEIAGTVEAVGAGVHGLKIGQRVVSLHWASCGSCGACVEGRTTCCASPADFLALTANGGYADALVAGETCFVPIPSGWSAVEAASVMCTYGTVWHGITKGRLQPGESVVVTGASGGVGTAAVKIMRQLGCNVTGVTSQADKEAFLRKIGCHHVVVTNQDAAFHKRLLAPVDFVFEAVGAPTFDSSLRSLKRGGRLVLAGNVTAGKVDLKLGLAIINGLEIIGTDSCTASELHKTFAFMDASGIRPEISCVLPLEEAGKAHEILEAKKVQGRIVLKVTPESQW